MVGEQTSKPTNYPLFTPQNLNEPNFFCTLLADKIIFIAFQKKIFLSLMAIQLVSSLADRLNCRQATVSRGKALSEHL
ncbi:hypothetical protein KFU94_62305 [Chloroflexi bacterium TSY]|nr:hypothetical protein [Chloroflexi bacterium TSY]